MESTYIYTTYSHAYINSDWLRLAPYIEHKFNT